VSVRARSGPLRADGERKRALIYDTALTLFRDKGFDATTMRDIAKAAGISLGSAYHYFPSKVAIVFAYYEEVQEAHERLLRKRLPGTEGLVERLALVFESKLELVRRDRLLLGAIGATLVQPGNELSAFSVEGRQFLERSVALFDSALEPLPASPQSRRTLAFLLWVAHLGMMLRLVHDDSRGQTRSKALVSRALTMAVPMLQLAATPVGAGLLAQLRELLAANGLMPDLEPTPEG